MVDLITTLASQAGINPGLAQKGLGALLCFLRTHLGADLFGKVEESVPGSADMITSYEEERAAAGAGSGGGHGILGAVVGLAGKLLGGQGASAAELMAELNKAGLSVEQITTFLPKAIELLRTYLPPEVMDKIAAYIPEAEASAAAQGTAPAE